MKKSVNLGEPRDPNPSSDHAPHPSAERPAAVEHVTHSPSCVHCDSSHERGAARHASPTQETMVERAVEDAVVRALFGGNEGVRRAVINAMGRRTFIAALSSVFPLAACKSTTNEELAATTAGVSAASTKNPLEKTQLKVGFVPITCATPIIMAEPLGFYKKQGLDVEVIKTAGWAVARDKSLSKEYDASHMLTPMPLAITLGVGSSPTPWLMPAVENLNGQAITLHVKHKDKRDPKTWKGLKFAVPFDYSMHNFLLRYYVAEHGLDPDKDIQIRVLPPPEMVANLKAGNVDGYFGTRPVQSTRRLRTSWVHSHTHQGNLARTPVLRVRGQR